MMNVNFYYFFQLYSLAFKEILSFSSNESRSLWYTCNAMVTVCVSYIVVVIVFVSLLALRKAVVPQLTSI